MILVATGVGGIFGAMALGALFGTGIVGLFGGIISAVTGGSFWDGFENGAFSGAIAGIISGEMGFGLSAGGKAALGLGKTMLIGAASGLGSSLISDLGDILIKGEDISLGEVFFNAAFSGAFAGASYGFSKAFGSLLKNSFWLSKAKELFRIGKTSNANYGKITSYTTTNPKGISINFSSYNSKSFRIEFDVSRYLHYHFSSLFGSKAHVPLSPIIDSSISRVISNYFLSED